MFSSAQLLFDILITDILPVFLVAGVGFLLARHVGIQPKVLSSVTFYALSPCLVFNIFITATISVFDFGRMAVFTIIVTIANGVLARLVAIPLRLDRAALVGFMLVTMFSNTGNFGLPLVLFAFGREALAYASVYFVCTSLLAYTAGVFLAASGRRSFGQALIGVTRVPVVYAVLAGVLVRAVGATLPTGVMRASDMLADATLPMMLLILGTQLNGFAHPKRPAAVIAAVLLSLVAAPVLAYSIATAMDLTGVAFQAAVLQASMPAAVVTTVLALQFDLDAELPAAVVFATTLLSPLTVALLIAYLRA